MGCTAALYNTDYYVVSPLTLMGCYSDLKWFNGSQVGPLMAFFILQCVLWMWMTVLWSASVFLLHLLKQCDRCCFSVQEKWGISGGGHAMTPQTSRFLSFPIVHRPQHITGLELKCSCHRAMFPPAESEKLQKGQDPCILQAAEPILIDSGSRT